MPSPSEANAAHEIRSRQHLSTCWALCEQGKSMLCCVSYSMCRVNLSPAILVERLLYCPRRQQHDALNQAVSRLQPLVTGRT